MSMLVFIVVSFVLNFCFLYCLIGLAVMVLFCMFCFGHLSVIDLLFLFLSCSCIVWTGTV